MGGKSEYRQIVAGPPDSESQMRVVEGDRKSWACQKLLEHLWLIYTLGVARQWVVGASCGVNPFWNPRQLHHHVVLTGTRRNPPRSFLHPCSSVQSSWLDRMWLTVMSLQCPKEPENDVVSDAKSQEAAITND